MCAGEAYPSEARPQRSAVHAEDAAPLSKDKKKYASFSNQCEEDDAGRRRTDSLQVFSLVEGTDVLTQIPVYSTG